MNVADTNPFKQLAEQEREKLERATGPRDHPDTQRTQTEPAAEDAPEPAQEHPSRRRRGSWARDDEPDHEDYGSLVDDYGQPEDGPELNRRPPENANRHSSASSASGDDDDDDDDDDDLPLLNVDAIKKILHNDISSSSLDVSAENTSTATDTQNPNVQQCPGSFRQAPMSPTTTRPQRPHVSLTSDPVAVESTASGASDNHPTDGQNVTSIPEQNTPQHQATPPVGHYHQSARYTTHSSTQTDHLPTPITTPLRPPVLPKRRSNSSSKKVSSLDPGSISTVGSQSFYGHSSNGSTYTSPGTVPQKIKPPLPPRSPASPVSPDFQNDRFPSNRPPLTPHSPSLPSRRAPPNSSYDIRPFSQHNAYSTPSLEMAENHLSYIPSNTSAGSTSSTPTYPQHPTIGPSHSLPVITISEQSSHNGPPPLPKKPQLPKRPALISNASGNASAYELLEGFSRRSSLSGAHNTNNNEHISPIQESNPSTIADVSSGHADDLDMESLRRLGITEEMINQQREIEQSFERQRMHEHNASIPEDAVVGAGTNTNVLSVGSTDQVSINSRESDEVPDDVSQLEIPVDMSTMHSTTSNLSTDSQSNTSTATVDVFAGGDITEEEFISLLPQVPAYTSKARETEISIPNGMAIDMMLINENHPNEDPPAYTSVSDTLRAIINRPQFSQTGGDTRSVRRREREEQMILQQQQHLQRQSRNRYNNGSTATNTAVTPFGRSSTRRLPPRPSTTSRQSRRST